VAFACNGSQLATALIQLRTVTRVLVRVAEFRATKFAQLERQARAISWNVWQPANRGARFRVTCRKSRLYHSDAVAERIAGAVAEQVPGVQTAEAARDDDDDAGDAQLFVVRMSHDVCTISVDAAGAPLYMRGYRQEVAKAPLRETLAAAMLIGAGWNRTTAVCDVFCGSGTIVIEAALIARGIAPGLKRSFAAERWPSADGTAWREVRARAQSGVRDVVPPPLVGTDRDAGAIEAARANAERAGVGDDIEFRVAAMSDASAPAATGLLVTNPPYGVRTGEAATLRNLYARLGAVARDEFAGWHAAILSGDRTSGHVLERQLRLRLTPAWRSVNGGIPVRLLLGAIGG